MDRSRRSVLFLPADSTRKAEKAASLDVDSIVLDLEDGVAVGRKDEARRTAVESLSTIDFGRRERLVRINPLATGLGEVDLRTALEAPPDGIVIPKASTAEDVLAVARLLDAAGARAADVRLVAIIETARGVVEVASIAASTDRLAAIGFGAEDLAGDVGAERTREGREVFYARSAVVTAAAAFGRDPLDMVFIDLGDLEGLERETVEARQLGYVGKMAIHPKQVPVIHRALAPTAEQVETARRLLRAHQEHQDRGSGVFELDGKMVDMPMVRAAERILARASDGEVPST